MYSKPQLSGRGAQGSHVRFESNTPHYSKSTPLCTQFSEINSVSHVLRNTLITPRPRDQMNQIPVQKRAQRRQSFSKAMSKPLPNRPTLRRSVSSDAQIPTVNTTAINRPVGTITNTNVNINTNPSTSISSSTNNSISTTAINNTDINGNSNSNGNGNENANANFNGNVNFNTTTPSQKEIINSLLDNERVPEPDSPVRPPNFWNPRQEGQGLSTQKLSHQWRSLWKPRRTLLEQTSEDQFTHDRLQSLERTRTPSIQQDSGVVDPFLLLQNTLEVADTRELQFLDTEFNQIDTYATNVNQRGQMVTPQLLAQKFLARPYRRDLHKVRSIFIWLVQNIAIQETETWTDETAEQVLAKRSCTSSFGLAALFCEMARAAGINDTQVICGYCRGPKDTLKDAFEDGYLVQNHAWCSIKVEGEYRMVDCWLASPNHPLNEGVESHWFLTTPLSMIHTHLPSDDRDQYLDPPLYLSSFLSLPHVWIPFFSHHIQVVDFDPSTLTLVDNQTYHLTIRMDPDTACCVQVECQDGTLVRGLAQLEPSSNHRTYKIKAVLPLDTHAGWLQVYCGPRSTFVAEQQTSPYSLAMSFPLKHTGKTRAFEFVKLHPNHEEFFIDEPQCYQIYPRQPYSFRIIKDDSRHPKMAIKSPTGKIFKLLYTPQDHSYTGNITVTEIGQWTLVCLYHHAERWQTVANWECRI
ncbi:hypothetical protein J3Q64DRAFT_1706913 [Phycomyces blakesleeanus]|uniref:Transglutaminase-like domain-containing protein n=1 Tax=Phycomyces blakesleeanus TaxID=4837 RepID=A0ABR3BC14_PHYBL